ncbi:MAG: hypothetical protein FWG11_00520 [Promicromonosporaceae bacterium]|nr:hypothetical protein [Promicromonosporaceae bacterium]
MTDPQVPGDGEDDAPFIYVNPDDAFAPPVEQADNEPPARLTILQWLPRLAAGAGVGVAAAALGTAHNRTLWAGLPGGLVLGLLLTLSAALLLRSWRGLPMLLAGGLAWVIVTQLLSLERPGGDVLINDPAAAIPFAWTGLVWLYAGLVVWGIVAFLPRRWFTR